MHLYLNDLCIKKKVRIWNFYYLGPDNRMVAFNYGSLWLYPIPVAVCPMLTGGWPILDGGWPMPGPLVAWPMPVGGWPRPDGGWPMPEGGWPMAVGTMPGGGGPWPMVKPDSLGKERFIRRSWMAGKIEQRPKKGSNYKQVKHKHRV